MKAAQFYGVGDVRVEEIDEPEPGPGEVLVDVAACGICGSDLHFYREGFPYTDERPVTLGHESAGTVIETGEGVDLAVGTDVALGPHTPCLDCPYCESALYNLCRNMNEMSTRPGAFAERAVESAGTVVPLPEGLSAEDAALAQPLSVGLHAVRESSVGLGDSALVVGTGPIGLGAVRFAASAGAEPIFVSEPNDSRRSIAGEFGADVLLDPTEVDPVERVREATDVGVDVAFEAVGHEATLAQAVESTRGGGHTRVIGVFSEAVDFDPGELVGYQRSVAGSRSHQLGPNLANEYGVALAHLADGRVDPDRYVSSRIPIDDIVSDGFEALLDPESEERKILVRP